MLPLVQRMRGLRSLPSRCHRLLASSFRLPEETDDSRDTFGRLALKHRQRHHRDQESVTHNEESFQPSTEYSRSYQGALKPLTEASEFSQDSMLEKWQRFKGAQDQENQEMLRWSDSQQDDAEEDYHLFLAGRSARSRGQKDPHNKKLHQKVTKSAVDTFGGVGPPQEPPEGEVFGHLTPTYEAPEDDEGDLREEAYQEAKLGRRHRPQFYGMKMKQLCRERKVCGSLCWVLLAACLSVCWPALCSPRRPF